jgi:saccharopine dehydrogenase (NADP+, L-glutamate forming)/spermidine synthase
VEHLVKAGFEVTVASRTVSKAERIVESCGGGNALKFDITTDTNLREMIREHDVAVSLLPYTCHPFVAEACIEEGKHMVTTSYISDTMKGFDASAKEAGIILMNEMGLDPGIDHMEAQRVIDEVHNEGGRIEGFISYCGGLPAPEANTNPWGYKFSWSPRGVVLASKNNARFKKEGQILDIPGKELFANYEMIDIPGLGEFEGYPNRDSVPYADIYGIPDANTVLRGTLRNKGWCDTWKGLHDIGILEEMPTKAVTYMEMMEELLPNDGDLTSRALSKIRTRNDDVAVENWKWLGLFSDREISCKDSKMDSLSDLLERKLVYSQGERDMIILQHRFDITLSDGTKTTRTSTMVDFGEPGGDSAMSRTVGIPAAIGVQMILEGKLDHLKGVHMPILPEIYGPALEMLKDRGIEFKEG